MNADVLTTRVADGIAVITLGSARRIYFDEEMGDALTEALGRFAGDANVRVVVVTGGAPGYFIRHFTVAALIRLAESLRAFGRECSENATSAAVLPGAAITGPSPLGRGPLAAPVTAGDSYEKNRPPRTRRTGASASG